MKLITGCIIEKDNSILMVKEAKKKCYGQWNFPGGHLEEQETLLESAIRETLEETGYHVKLTGILPIFTQIIKEETYLIFHFTAEIVGPQTAYHSKEILEVKWIPLNQVKTMGTEELREAKINQALITCLEKGQIYPLEIICS